MKKIIALFFFIWAPDAIAQNPNSYELVDSKAKRETICDKCIWDGDSYQNFNVSTGKFTLGKDEYCSPMQPLPDLNNPYEFIFDFTVDSKFFNSEKTPIRFSLGRLGTNGYTHFSISKNGDLTVGYVSNKLMQTRLKVSNPYQVALNKKNQLRFIQFPDGTYFFEMNGYSMSSKDLPPESQIIPSNGLRSTICFNTDLIIHQLKINIIRGEFEIKRKENDQKSTSPLSNLEDATTELQVGLLLNRETDQERIQLFNSMKMIYDSPTFGNCINGYGIYEFSNGPYYIGYWKNSKMHGKGKIYIDGELFYNGNFENGVKHGYGELVIDDFIFKGNFENDEMNGNGELFKQGKSVFKGQFKNGEPVED